MAHLSMVSDSVQIDAREALVRLLATNLDFHDHDSGYASHNFHAFPAKFPPQLPRRFIEGLTQLGDVVLDPMLGSGTTILEALFAGRNGVGFDIDPLAIKIARVKTTALETGKLAQIGQTIIALSREAVQTGSAILIDELQRRWDAETNKFVNYWFARETQIELLALVKNIQQIADPHIREFFEITLSGIIITKSGGVSLAFDLAHTRPHRAKIVYSRSGEVLVGSELTDKPTRRMQLLTKRLRSPIDEFSKRLGRNLAGLIEYAPSMLPPEIRFGDAQDLPIDSASVDLIVTSPPYISNAIDYMRAHKFSLIWLGESLRDLSQKRKEYIGGETTTGFEFAHMPAMTSRLLEQIGLHSQKKARVVHRYYSEMDGVLREMFRVLKPGAAAVVVVGTSFIGNVDTRIAECLADLGAAVGFDVAGIAVRNLDRNRRMLPAGAKVDSQSQIQRRMHEEYVIGLYKPYN